MFLPSGRLHAVGAGNLIVEIQQNSDTTYRVFDWDRAKKGGAPRKMHIAEALQCIDFSDREPALLKPEGESFVRHSIFEIEKWLLPGRTRDRADRKLCHSRLPDRRARMRRSRHSKREISFWFRRSCEDPHGATGGRECFVVTSDSSPLAVAEP